MKINKQRAILIVIAMVTLSLGVAAVFIGYRLSQTSNVGNEPSNADLPGCCTGGPGQGTCDTWEVCDVPNGACQSGTSCRAADCRGDGGSCTDNWQCCSGSCSGGTCQGGNACTSDGESCSSDGECCSNNCSNSGTCEAAPSNFACDSDPSICDTNDEGTCWTHAGSGCWWINGGCECGNPGGGGVSPADLSASCSNGGWSVTNNGGSSAQVSVASCRNPSSGTWTLDEYNANTNNGTQCTVGCGSSTVTVGPGETQSGGVGAPSCGRWQVDVVYQGTTLCAEAACNEDGCTDTPPPTNANCLESCEQDSDCGDGLKCGTVGQDQVCIDDDLTNGDACFNVSCEDLTVSPTTAAVGATVDIDTNWTAPESYTAVSTKIFNELSSTNPLKDCTDTDTCSLNWTVAEFPSNNKHEFNTTFEFSAYDYASNFVCNTDGEVVLGSTVVGSCTNDCVATLTKSQTGGEPAYPSCTSLVYTKDDTGDSTFPISGTLTGTAENGDADNNLESYEIVLVNDSGTETLTGTIDETAQTTVTFDETYSITSDTTATLTVVDANGEEYTDTACKIDLTGEGSLPSTGLLDGTIFVVTLGTLMLLASYLIYTRNAGSESLAQFYLGSFAKVSSYKDSFSKRSSRLLSRKENKRRFEKRTLEKEDK